MSGIAKRIGQKTLIRLFAKDGLIPAIVAKQIADKTDDIYTETVSIKHPKVFPAATIAVIQDQSS